MFPQPEAVGAITAQAYSLFFVVLECVGYQFAQTAGGE